MKLVAAFWILTAIAVLRAVVQAVMPEQVLIVVNDRSSAGRLNFNATSSRTALSRDDMTACPALSVCCQREQKHQRSTVEERHAFIRKERVVQLLRRDSAKGARKNGVVERYRGTASRRGQVSCWRAWPRSGAHQALLRTAFVAVDVATDALVKEARLAPRNV